MKLMLKACVSLLLCFAMLANVFSCTLVLKEDIDGKDNVVGDGVVKDDEDSAETITRPKPNGGSNGNDDVEWGGSDYENESKNEFPDYDDPWTDGYSTEPGETPVVDPEEAPPSIGNGSVVQGSQGEWYEDRDDKPASSGVAGYDYVSDGLVAWFDGNNNSNGSHSLAANVWKDLSGNANHWDLSEAVSLGQISWKQGGMEIADGGCYIRLPQAITETLTGNAYTMEIVFGDLDYTATNYITIMASANDELALFIRVSDMHAPGMSEQYKLEYKNQDANGDLNRPYLYDAWSYLDGHTLALTSDLYMFDGNRDIYNYPEQEGNVILYSDATQIAKGESEYCMTLDHLYLGHTAVQREWHGEIHGIRVYNRALSAEEVAANAKADQWNYRSGRTIAPETEYDPALDQKYEGFSGLYGYQNNVIVLNSETNLIPMAGFREAFNLLDYLYPYENDAQWTGARLCAESQNNDILSFSVDYSDNYCYRAGFDPVSGAEARYIVLKMILNGSFSGLDMNVVAYDADQNLNLVVPYTIDRASFLDMDGEVQYLVIDTWDTSLKDCESMERLYFNIHGMKEDCEIYLMEIAFFPMATDVEQYVNFESEIVLPTESDSPDLSGMVAYLPLDKKIDNEIVSNINPQQVGDPAWDAGLKGAAFSPDNLGYLSLGDDWKPGTESFSVGMWVKGTSSSGQVCLLANQCWATEDTGFVFVWYQHQDAVRAMFNFNGVKREYRFDVPDDYLDRWMYVTIVVDREYGQIKMSFDFAEFQVFDLDPTICANGVRFDAYNEYDGFYRPVAIGNDGDGCRNVPMGNLIDEVVVLDRAVTYTDLDIISKFYGAY